MSSIHEGVSCDGCMAPNFAGDRYKCLRCYDFDLCSQCYADERAEGRAESHISRESSDEHQPTHPMQCIMTQQDFELTYRGDQSHCWDKWRVVIFTCPVCGAQGFSRDRLVAHVIEEHSSPPRSPNAQRFEMACPICISTDSYRAGFGDYMPNQLTDMAAHMQEHHSQAPVENGETSVQSTRSGGLPEFLRDRDLRRVFARNAPLVGSDSDFDDTASDMARRGAARISSQRSDVFPRIRRRAAATDRQSNESIGNDDDGSGLPQFGFRLLSAIRRQGAAETQQLPPSSAPQVNSEAPHSSGSSVRMRSLRQVSSGGSGGSRTPGQPSEQNVSPRGTPTDSSSQRTARGAITNGAVTFSRTFHAPITGSQPLTNPVASDRGGVVQTASRQTNSRGGIRSVRVERNAPSQRLAAGGSSSALDNSSQRNTSSTAGRSSLNKQTGSRSASRREHNHAESESIHSSGARVAVSLNSNQQQTATTNVPGLPSHRLSEAAMQNVDSTSRENASRNTVTSSRPSFITNNVGRPILLLSLPSKKKYAPEKEQKSVTLCIKLPLAEKAKENLEAEQLETETKKSKEVTNPRATQPPFCPMFTSKARFAHPLPVLKLKRDKVCPLPPKPQPKDIVTPQPTSIEGKMAVRNPRSLHPIIRIGRPLVNGIAERNGVSSTQGASVSPSTDEWWPRRRNEQLDADILLRYSRRSRASASQNQPSAAVAAQATDRMPVYRGDLASLPVSRAVEVIRRLDARGVRSHRPSTTYVEAGVTTGNPDYLNGNILPPSAAGMRQYYQLPAAVLNGSYFFGRDPVTEAVAREVAAFSEASGARLRHLHSLLRRSEAAMQAATQTGAQPSARQSNSGRADGKQRGPRSRKSQEPRDDELCTYFSNMFKVPRINTILDGTVIQRKRTYKRFRMKERVDYERFFYPWLGKELELDEHTDISDRGLDEVIRSLASQIPEFASDPIFVEGLFGIDYEDDPVDDAPMFEASQGSEDEMLVKKCLSSNINRSARPHIVIGPTGTAFTEQDNSSSIYWKDYRFLHNRRDIFFMKSLSAAQENKLLPLACRFPRQLLLGVLDVPASIYIYAHYLPHMFARVLRTNLRESPILRASEDSVQGDSTEHSTEGLLGLDSGSDPQWEPKVGPQRAKTVHVHPLLWYFLDLAGFIECNV